MNRSLIIALTIIIITGSAAVWARNNLLSADMKMDWGGNWEHGQGGQ
jgi:hypothetical protein